MMKVIYHPYFTDHDYSSDPAAERGRIQCILDELEDKPDIDFCRPKTAEREEIELVHSPEHVQSIKQRSAKLYEMAGLSAGGALTAAKFAHEGSPTFAVIRPPGHHASPESNWGFCYFNNMAVAIKNLKDQGKIKSAFIMDFDLHTGDGNINCLGDDDDMKIVNPRSDSRTKYIEKVERHLETSEGYDILGVSAGFDLHINDWGGTLETKDYNLLGKMLRDFSKDKCQGRRFAILEGGYNHEVLGKNVSNFIDGFSDRLY